MTIHDYDDDPAEPDPPEFDRARVPDGPWGEWFFDGRTGRGLTDDEYDEMKRRFQAAGDWPFDHADS